MTLSEVEPVQEGKTKDEDTQDSSIEVAPVDVEPEQLEAMDTDKDSDMFEKPEGMWVNYFPYTANF